MSVSFHAFYPKDFTIQIAMQFNKNSKSMSNRSKAAEVPSAAGPNSTLPSTTDTPSSPPQVKETPPKNAWLSGKLKAALGIEEPSNAPELFEESQGTASCAASHPPKGYSQRVPDAAGIGRGSQLRGGQSVRGGNILDTKPTPQQPAKSPSRVTSSRGRGGSSQGDGQCADPEPAIPETASASHTKDGKWLQTYIGLKDAAIEYFNSKTHPDEMYVKLASSGGLLTLTHSTFFGVMHKSSTTFMQLETFPILMYLGAPAVIFVSNRDRVILLLSSDYFTPEDTKAVYDRNWFLADFGAVDPKLDAAAATPKLKQRLMGMLRGMSFADAIRKKVDSETDSTFPHFLFQDVETQLRPTMTRTMVVDGLISCSPHPFITDDTDSSVLLHIFNAKLEAVLQKPMVINGSSGSGKTVLALQAAKYLENVFLNPGGSKERGTEWVVLGLYLKPGCEHTENVAAEIASGLRTLLNKVFTNLNPIERSLKNVLLHVVLDEVGSRTDLCKEILSSHINVCNEIKAELSKSGAAGDEGYEGCAIQDKDSLKLSLTLVGTGVAYPDAKGSRGFPYWRVSSNTASLEVMRRILNLGFSVIDEKAKSAGRKKEKKEPNELAVERMLKFVEFDRLLSILVGNKRMAAQMAQGLLKYTDFSGELHLVSSAVALATVREYISTNAWSTIMDTADEKTHMANLLSLVTTQSHGCHVLSQSDLTTLTTAVGAVEDMLEWRDTDVQQPFEHPADANVNSDLIYKKPYAGKLMPLVKEVVNGRHMKSVKAYFRTRQPGVEDPNGRIRYHIPPALALMALIRYAYITGVWLFSSDQQQTAVTYERFTAPILAATLNAFASHNVLDFPAHLLFLRRAGSDAQGDINDVLKTHEMRSFPQGRQTKRKQITPIEFDWLRNEDNEADGLEPLTNPETVFVVEAALPKAAQNDCILYGKGLAIGIENKFYLDEGVVSASVLVKRACQMGYSEVYCEFPCSTWPPLDLPKATEDAPKDTKKDDQKDAKMEPTYGMLAVTKKLHEFFTSQDSDIIDFKRCEYDNAMRKVKVTISTEAAALNSKENRLAMVRSCLLAKSSHAKFGVIKDVVVLSGPSGQTLIPEATTVAFRNPYTIRLWGEGTEEFELPWNPMSTRTKNVKLNFSLDKPTEAEVVTWNLSLEQFLRASSIPTEVTSAQQRIEYDCNVDLESRDKKQFVAKTFYVTESSKANHIAQTFTIKVPVVKK